MVRVLGIALLALWVWALAESILTPRDQVRLLPKVAWIVVIVLLGPVGAIGWFLLGRSRRDPGEAGVGRADHPQRPIRGPDDDPDFLRGL